MSGVPPNERSVTLSLPRDVLERTERECDRRMVSKRRLIQAALVEWLENHEGKDL